jgi:hypothetical protein
MRYRTTHIGQPQQRQRLAARHKGLPFRAELAPWTWATCQPIYKLRPRVDASTMQQTCKYRPRVDASTLQPTFKFRPRVGANAAQPRVDLAAFVFQASRRFSFSFSPLSSRTCCFPFSSSLPSDRTFVGNKEPTGGGSIFRLCMLTAAAGVCWLDVCRLRLLLGPNTRLGIGVLRGDEFTVAHTSKHLWSIWYDRMLTVMMI